MPIRRYTLPEMKDLFGREETKFEYWLLTEVAVLQARIELGFLNAPVEIIPKLKNLRVNIARIDELEATGRHDLIAFVQSMQEQFPAIGLGQYQAEFHNGMTSYDTEEAPTILILRKAVGHILNELKLLKEALRQRAIEHKWTKIIAFTHGQYAEPSTFGHLLVVYMREIERCIRRLEYDRDMELSEAKISGAVGNYPFWPPEVERRALEIVGLRPSSAETQIMQRDRHARILQMLALVAACVQHLAEGFHFRMSSRVGELEEPIPSGKRSSSAMSHKRNPDITERCMGMARLMRGYANVALENIATKDFRDISQSGPERVIIPDACTYTHYIVTKMAWIVDGMTIFPEVMLENLEHTRGVWASQRVRVAMMDKGIDYDTAYLYTQTCGYEAKQHRKHMIRLLRVNEVPGTDMTAEQIIGRKALKKCFDPIDYIGNGIEHIFEGVEDA